MGQDGSLLPEHTISLNIGSSSFHLLFIVYIHLPNLSESGLCLWINNFGLFAWIVLPLLTYFIKAGEVIEVGGGGVYVKYCWWEHHWY